jgi:Carboxypeptidase regulatory-like domain
MKTLRFWQRVAVALSLLFTLAAVSYGADVNGRIKGTVTDPSGAVVAGVHVTATNEATGVSFTTTSGTDGIYLFAQLPVGTYDVVATSQNFKKFSATGIVLNIDQEYIENVQLSVGSTNEIVQVSASAVQVDTTDMQLSNVVSSEQMEELPLIGRNFTGLELTLPGVQASSDRFGSFSVSGAQTQQSSFLINGADSNDIALNTLVIAPNLDAIDQFNLIDGPLNAEYDRNSGGIVSATIKEGSNHFHGDAFEFYRDTFLNTANFFQHSFTTGAAIVSPYHQNIYGGTVGGPVLRDKLFFFGAYQGENQTVPESGGSVGVYNSALLAGNFSVDNGALSSNPIPGTITIPGCTPGETWAACGAALNYQFPTSSFNPVATKLISTFVPTPNSGSYGYLFSPVDATSENQYIGRIDYALNPNNQFYGVYIYQGETTTETLPFTGASLPGFGDEDTEHINQVTFDYVHQFSPTLVNDFTPHYTRFNYGAVIPQKPVLPSSVGFDIDPENTSGAGLPAISVSGNTYGSAGGVGFELGFSTNGPQPRIDQVIQVDDDVSKVLGKHTFKFGYDGRRFNVSNPFSAQNNGNFGFNSGGTYSSGDGALDFLLGVPASYGQGSGADIQADAFLNYLFAQDTWKTTDSLTLSYGLSYSIDTPLHNNQYQGEGIICFSPGYNSTIFTGAPTGLAYPGENGCNNSGLATTRYSEVGPRLGFAWAPDLGSGMKWLTGGSGKKFAIRGGFGIYYNRTEEESSLQTLETPPFGLSSAGAVDFASQGATAASFVNPYIDLNSGTSYNNKFPYAFPHKGETISPATWASVEPMFLSTYDSNFRAPYAENFQLSVEREVPSHAIVRITYVGSLARHNQATYEGDYITTAGHAACLASTACAGYDPTIANGETASSGNRNIQGLVYPQDTIGNDAALAGVGEVGSTATSNYNSLQAEVIKAPTHGLTFQLSYTYSHALDSASSFEDAGFGESGARGYNRFDPALNYGDSQFDARQRLVFSPIYVIPRFSGSSYSPLNLAVSGWEISGITTLATGFPYDLAYAGGTSRSLYCSDDLSFYACPDVPEQVKSLTFGNPRNRASGGGSSLYLTNLFTLDSAGDPIANAILPEPLGSFGNEHRNPYHGPGLNNTNLILAKNFMVVPEHNISIQLRMESDNVFNHSQFSNPGSSYNTSFTTSGAPEITSGAGYIGSAAAGRQSQIAAKIYF